MANVIEKLDGANKGIRHAYRKSRVSIIRFRRNRFRVDTKVTAFGPNPPFKEPCHFPALIALQINPNTGSIVRFDWNNPVPSLCTTSLLGQCGAGIVDAKAAVKAVVDLQ